MSRICTVCDHAERTAIERGLVAGEPIRRLAAQHALAETSLRRHRDSHLRKALARALEKTENFEVDGDKLIAWAHALQAKTLVILERAEQLDDLGNAARLIGEARRNLELIARVVGVLEAPIVNIDARRQVAVLGRLDEDALRALASGDVIDGQAELVSGVKRPRKQHDLGR